MADENNSLEEIVKQLEFDLAYMRTLKVYLSSTTTWINEEHKKQINSYLVSNLKNLSPELSNKLSNELKSKF